MEEHIYMPHTMCVRVSVFRSDSHSSRVTSILASTSIPLLRLFPTSKHTPITPLPTDILPVHLSRLPLPNAFLRWTPSHPLVITSFHVPPPGCPFGLEGAWAPELFEFQLWHLPAMSKRASHNISLSLSLPTYKVG